MVILDLDLDLKENFYFEQELLWVILDINHMGCHSASTLTEAGKAFLK